MIKVFNSDLLKNTKKFSLVKKGSVLFTVLTITATLSACSANTKSNNLQEYTTSNVSQIDNVQEIEAKDVDESMEDWVSDEYNGYNPYFLKINFDSMLVQRLKLSKEVLNNNEFSKILDDIKNYFGTTPLYYCSMPISNNTNVGLSVMDNENNFNHVLYMNNYIDQVMYNYSEVYISYERHDNQTYPIVDLTYNYKFDKKGNIQNKDNTAIYYNSQLEGSSYQISTSDESVKEQTMTYNGNIAPFKIELHNKNKEDKNCKLVISTVLGNNNIPLTGEDYELLSNEMKKYYDDGNLLGFIGNNKEILQQYLESVKDESDSDCFNHAETLINLYGEKEQVKVLGH
jgi:hypothetical protein